MDYFDIYSLQPFFKIKNKRTFSTNEGLFFSLIFMILSSCVLFYNFYNIYKENEPILVSEARLLKATEILAINKDTLEVGLNFLNVMPDKNFNVKLDSLKVLDMKTINRGNGKGSIIAMDTTEFNPDFNFKRTIAGNFTRCPGKFGDHKLLEDSICTNFVNDTILIGGDAIKGNINKKFHLAVDVNYCDLSISSESDKLLDDFYSEDNNIYDEFLKIVSKENQTNSEIEFLKKNVKSINYDKISDLQFIYPFEETPNMKYNSERTKCIHEIKADLEKTKLKFQYASFYLGISYKTKIFNKNEKSGYLEFSNTDYFYFNAFEENVSVNIILTKNIVETDDNLFFKIGSNRFSEFYDTKVEITKNPKSIASTGSFQAYYIYTINPKLIYTFRSYNKIDTVLANCFSIIKVFHFFLYALFFIFEENLYKSELIKTVYKYTDDEKESIINVNKESKNESSFTKLKFNVNFNSNNNLNEELSRVIKLNQSNNNPNVKEINKDKISEFRIKSEDQLNNKKELNLSKNDFIQSKSSFIDLKDNLPSSIEVQSNKNIVNKKPSTSIKLKNVIDKINSNYFKDDKNLKELSIHTTNSIMTNKSNSIIKNLDNVYSSFTVFNKLIYSTFSCFSCCIESKEDKIKRLLNDSLLNFFDKEIDIVSLLKKSIQHDYLLNKYLFIISNIEEEGFRNRKKDNEVKENEVIVDELENNSNYQYNSILRSHFLKPEFLSNRVFNIGNFDE